MMAVTLQIIWIMIEWVYTCYIDDNSILAAVRRQWLGRWRIMAIYEDNRKNLETTDNQAYAWRPVCVAMHGGG